MKTCVVPFDMFEDLCLTVYATRIREDFIEQARLVEYFGEVKGGGLTVYEVNERGFDVAVLLWLEHGKTMSQLHSYLAHELTHAVQCISEHLAIDNDEFRANLHQYITKKCLEAKIL